MTNTYVEKSVQLVIGYLSEMTCYKIHTLVQTNNKQTYKDFERDLF